MWRGWEGAGGGGVLGVGRNCGGAGDGDGTLAKGSNGI